MYFRSEGKHAAVPAEPSGPMEKLLSGFLALISKRPCGQSHTRQMLGENTKAGAVATGARRANTHSAASLTGLDVSE